MAVARGVEAVCTACAGCALAAFGGIYDPRVWLERTLKGAVIGHCPALRTLFISLP